MPITNLPDEIKKNISLGITDELVSNRFLKRLEEGNYTRDENPQSHYCVYFLPYNPETKRVFIIHHKKAGLWLFPGGHIDKGETLTQTLKREIQEELGVVDKVKEEIQPFLLTIILIENPNIPCKEHLDIWYRIPASENEFNIDPREFHATRWTTIEEARGIITDKPNLDALDRMEKFFES